jgi:hypothetical protein
MRMVTKQSSGYVFYSQNRTGTSADEITNRINTV